MKTTSDKKVRVVQVQDQFSVLGLLADAVVVKPESKTKKEIPIMMNYDPNYCHSGNCAVQRVRVTLGQWGYRLTLETEIGGNCLGFMAIEGAIDNLSDDYFENTLTLTDPDTGKQLIVENDDEDDDWIKSMVIGVEIVDITPTNLDD